MKSNTIQKKGKPNERMGYVRVSDKKQENGASLQEQKRSIEEYASKHHLKIVDWYVEVVSASTPGRPEFTKMCEELQKGKAGGIIIHKIDRSMRNYADWGAIGQLNDAGYEVNFSHESLDLNSRSDRLSADIQAVFAVDYIRNLKQEIKKGIYGRLREGIYPFRSPIGYTDNGRGTLKTIDPIQGELVKKLYRLYVFEGYGYEALVKRMYEEGLRSKGGKKVTIRGITTILKNRFYIGEMVVKGQVYQGKHDTLISRKLFNLAQSIAKGRSTPKVNKRVPLFSRTIQCANCKNRLVGEYQKGRYYYRCHTKGCLTKCLREDYIEESIATCIQHIQLNPSVTKDLDKRLHETAQKKQVLYRKTLKSIELELTKIQTRIDKLVDIYLDGGLEQQLFNKKKDFLLADQEELIQRKAQLDSQSSIVIDEALKFLELHKNVILQYAQGKTALKTKIVKMLFSNLQYDGKKLYATMNSPYFEVQDLTTLPVCEPISRQTRTFSTPKTIVINAEIVCKIKKIPKAIHVQKLYDLFISYFTTHSLSEI